MGLDLGSQLAEVKPALLTSIDEVFAKVSLVPFCFGSPIW